MKRSIRIMRLVVFINFVVGALRIDNWIYWSLVFFGVLIMFSCAYLYRFGKSVEVLCYLFFSSIVIIIYFIFSI